MLPARCPYVVEHYKKIRMAALLFCHTESDFIQSYQAQSVWHPPVTHKENLDGGPNRSRCRNESISFCVVIGAWSRDGILVSCGYLPAGQMHRLAGGKSRWIDSLTLKGLQVGIDGRAYEVG